MHTSLAVKLVRLITDCLFPRFCVGCDRIGSFLCTRCYSGIQFCPLPVNLNLENNYLQSVVAMADYAPPISNLIHALKYQSVEEVGTPCGQLLFHTTALPAVDLIVPVPIHQKRLRERGFNQSAVIAQELSRLMSVPAVPLLARVRHSAPQARVSDRATRLTHLAHSFALNAALTPQQRAACHTVERILLVDDVCTTGTTLNECARVLVNAGAREVYAVTLAHGA